jgi:hypothetical protein
MYWLGRSRVRVAVVATALAWAALGGAARAQAPESSFDGLGKWLRLGDAVSVTGVDGRKASGKLTNLSPASMTILRDGGPLEFQSASVRTVSIREHDSMFNGAVIGLAAGVAFGAIALGTSCHDDYYYSDCGGLVVVGALLYGAMGTGIGVGIDAITPGRTVVAYQRPAGNAPARVSVAPLLSHSRQGVVLRVAF